MIHNKFSQEKEDFIISEYLSGKTQKEIAVQLGTFNTSIRRVLLRNNISIISSKQRWSKRNNVFDSNTEEANYWIGFLVADGCISDDNKISLGSSEKDYYHLLKYSSFVSAPIKKIFNKRFHIYETRVIFRDSKIRNFLVDIGITPRKSLTIKLNIPLNEHILRGIFDGDGYARKSNGTVEIATGSVELSTQIIEYLHSKDISCTLHKGGNNVLIVGVYSRSSCKKFYELLYKDATIFLERKKDVLCPFYDENQ